MIKILAPKKIITVLLILTQSLAGVAAAILAVNFPNWFIVALNVIIWLGGGYLIYLLDFRLGENAKLVRGIAFFIYHSIHIFYGIFITVVIILILDQPLKGVLIAASAIVSYLFMPIDRIPFSFTRKKDGRLPPHDKLE